MRFRVKFGLVVAAVVGVLFISFFLAMFDFLRNAGRADPYALVTRLLSARGLLFMVMIILALALLEQKYARHEISMTKYLQLRKDKDGDHPRY